MLFTYLIFSKTHNTCDIKQRFSQHFELLQKASIPDHVSYPAFIESTTHARFSVSKTVRTLFIHWLWLPWPERGIYFSHSLPQNLLMYNYFKDAQRIAKEVKNSFSNEPEKSAELRRLEQVAEHNSVALNVICRVGALDPSLKVSFEFNHHPFLATAVVKRSWKVSVSVVSVISKPILK